MILVFLQKFRDYTLGGNLITRLQARYEALRRALGNETHAASSPAPTRFVLLTYILPSVVCR